MHRAQLPALARALVVGAVALVLLGACGPTSPSGSTPSLVAGVPTLTPSGGLATPSSTPTPMPLATRPPPTPPRPAPELPDGFPVMPGAVAENPPRSPDAAASWHSDAPGNEIYAWYVEHLPEAGFPIRALYPGGAAATILFGVPSGETLQLRMQGWGGASIIEVAAAVP